MKGYHSLSIRCFACALTVVVTVFRAAVCAIFVSGGVSGAYVDTPEYRCLLSGQSSEADGVWVRGIYLLPTFCSYR